MIDYEIKNGDLVLYDGDFRVVTGPLATRQRIEQKLKLWQGEWFLDTTAGFPWLQEILGRRPAPQIVRSLIFDLVQGDPGIRKVENIELDAPGVDRNLAIRFDATLVDGGTETIEVEV